MDKDIEVLLENELFSLKAGLAKKFFSLKGLFGMFLQIFIKKRNLIYEPYGILFGHRHYLVACDKKIKSKNYLYFSLSEINETFKF